MRQSPQVQSFGLRSGEDLTAVNETSDRAKPESCTYSLARTTSCILSANMEGPSSSYRHLGPQRWTCELGGTSSLAHRAMKNRETRK